MGNDLLEFELTEDNYYSKEADMKYMSFHQYNNFIGGNCVTGCEARAMAMLKGEWEEPTTKALMVGSYFDAAMEGTLEHFKRMHPEIFTQKGELRSEYKQAEVMLERVRRDEKFMEYCNGEKQTILTGYFAGADWRGKLDVYIPHTCIVDIKTSANLRKAWKVDDLGFVSFVEAFNYIGQLAVYRKLVEINYGEKLPCYIAAVSKEEEPDIEIIYIDEQSLDHAMNQIEANMPMVLSVKNGENEPIRCEKCNYCRSTRKIERPIHYMDLINAE